MSITTSKNKILSSIKSMWVSLGGSMHQVVSVCIGTPDGIEKVYEDGGQDSKSLDLVFKGKTTLRLKGNDIAVLYEDGTEDYIESASEYQNVVHDFEDSSNHLIKISGGVTALSTYVNSEDTLQEVRSAVPKSFELTSCSSMFRGAYITTVPSSLLWSQPNITSVSGMFRGCSKLSSIPKALFKVSTKINNLTQMFLECSSLKTVPSGLFDSLNSTENFLRVFYGSGIESVPDGLFAKCEGAKSFYQCFYNCKNLTSVGNNVFPRNAPYGGYTYSGTFYGDLVNVFGSCTDLVSIGADVFNRAKNATDASFAFSESSSLVEIPKGFMDGMESLTTVERIFNQCLSLKTIPEGLLKDCVNLTSVRHLCNHTALESIPADLLYGLTKITDAGAMFHTTNITEIPEDLFRDCHEIQDLTATFMGCAGLTAIPANLFEPTLKINNVDQLFNGCVNLEGEAPALWDKEKYKEDIYSRLCFGGCVKLSNHSEIPDGWK